MNELSKFLNRNNITQNELANALGIKQSTVSQWVTGYRPIGIERALQIENMYGVDADALNPKLLSILKQIKESFL